MLKKCILWILIISIPFYLFGCQKSNKSIPTHRLQWWLKEINWDNERGKETGKGITVAIIDSGIDTHKDLSGVDIIEFVLCDTENGNLNQHGTAMAGIICASPSDDNGLLGIAPSVNIISIDVSTESDDVIDPEILASAIDLAVTQNVDIINLSVGVEQCPNDLKDSIQHALDAGVIIVAAAGNFTQGNILYPAALNGVIAVSGFSKDGKALFPVETDKKIIYLPGQSIVSLSINNSYDSYFGTSPACAICTGIIAVLLEYNPDITMEEIVNTLSDEIDMKKIII